MAAAERTRTVFVRHRELTDEEKRRNGELRSLLEDAVSRRCEEQAEKKARKAAGLLVPKPELAQARAKSRDTPDPGPAAPSRTPELPPATPKAGQQQRLPKPPNQVNPDPVPQLATPHSTSSKHTLAAPGPSPARKPPRTQTSPQSPGRPKPSIVRAPRSKLETQDRLPKTPLEDAAEQFYLDRQVRECTPATMRCYRYDLGQFLAPLAEAGVTQPGQITAQHIRLYLQGLQNRQLSPWTTHQHARVIRSFCNFMVSEEIITKSPMARVGMPRLPKELLPPITKEEVELLLKAAEHGRHPVRDVALLLTLLDSGCRMGEALALQLGDVNLETGRVLVRLGKGRKDRVTFLGLRARAGLKEYVGRRRRASDALWRTDSGRPLTKGGLREIFRRLSLRSGVPDVQAHKFRRTFAIWSLRAGMNIFSLQMLMGHSDLKTLQRYLAIVEADLEAAHREHGAVDTML